MTTVGTLLSVTDVQDGGPHEIKLTYAEGVASLDLDPSGCDSATVLNCDLKEMKAALRQLLSFLESVK
jgi:hypothetical protein